MRPAVGIDGPLTMAIMKKRSWDVLLRMVSLCDVTPWCVTIALIYHRCRQCSITDEVDGHGGTIPFNFAPAGCVLKLLLSHNTPASYRAFEYDDAEKPMYWVPAKGTEERLVPESELAPYSEGGPVTKAIWACCQILTYALRPMFIKPQQLTRWLCAASGDVVAADRATAGIVAACHAAHGDQQATSIATTVRKRIF